MAGEINSEQLRAMLMEALGKGGGGPADSAGPAELLEHYKRLATNLKDASVKTQSFSKVLKGGIKELVDVTDAVKKLDEQIASMTEDDAKRELIAQREHIKKISREENIAILTRNFGIGLHKLTSTMGTTAAGAAGTFVRNLQNGSSGISLASGIMTAAVDVAGSAAAAGGAGLSAVGSAAMLASGKTKIFGAAVSVAGAILSGFGSGASKLAKFGIEVLTKEVEKSIKAYNDATTSGAFFAEGMTGLRKAANEAGLDVEQFSNVLVKHSTDLAALGMGVTEGAKRMGGALRAGGDTMQRQLVNLGFAIEDQAGLVAETMKQMRGTGGPLQASNAQVAAETMKYAENLRIISAITGEDAKKKTAQVQEQNQILAFQQKMAGKSETQRAQIATAMATMTEQEKKNFRDRVVLGTVVNKEGAIYEATVAGAREKGQAALDLFDNNNLTATTNAELNAKYGDQIKESILAQTSLGAAAFAVGGVLTGVATAMLDAVNQATAYNKESVAAAKDAVPDAANLKGGFADVTIEAQKLKVALGKELTDAIDDFVKFSKEILAAARSMIAGVSGGEGGEGLWNKTKRIGGAGLVGAAVGQTVGGVVGAGVGAVGGLGVASAATTPAGYAIGSAVGAIIGGLGGAIKEAIWGEPGKALGGIASGPASGFLEKLHGTEAVVPLPDGKTIPVAITSTSDSTSSTITSASDTSSNMMRDLLSRQLDLMQKTFDQTTEMLSSFNDSKQLQQQLVHNSY